MHAVSLPVDTPFQREQICLRDGKIGPGGLISRITLGVMGHQHVEGIVSPGEKHADQGLVILVIATLNGARHAARQFQIEQG